MTKEELLRDPEKIKILLGVNRFSVRCKKLQDFIQHKSVPDNAKISIRRSWDYDYMLRKPGNKKGQIRRDYFYNYSLIGADQIIVNGKPRKCYVFAAASR